MGKHFEATFGCDRASREIKMELERHYRRNVTVGDINVSRFFQNTSSIKES